MKTLPFAASAIFLACALPSPADTFTLKDGTTLEGSILKENPDSYTVEVKVTKSIKDERVIAKSDIVKIEREQVDLTAFQDIAQLKEIPDLLTSEEYAARIRAVEKFLKDHRGSAKTKEARDILAKLKAEANEILAGGLKINGKIISPTAYRANAYDIDARVQEAKIRALIKESRYLAALRTFSDFSRDFRNTSAHAELVPLVTQVINSYLAGIGESLASYDARVKERELGLQRMAAADRSATESAIREENAELEARLKAEQDAKIGWVTTHPFLKSSLDETMTFGKQELARLDALKNAPAVDGGKAYRDALGLIQGKGDANAINTAITAAKTAMVAPKYIEMLEAAAKAGK